MFEFAKNADFYGDHFGFDNQIVKNEKVLILTDLTGVLPSAALETILKIVHYNS